MQDLSKPNILLGNKAEDKVAHYISSKGYIVVNLRNNTGSQPFDQIAITNKLTYCYDVKNCSVDRFDFRRVENNQSLALEFITNNIQNSNVRTGFALVYNDNIYYLSYLKYTILLEKGAKSVKVSTLTRLDKLI